MKKLQFKHTIILLFLAVNSFAQIGINATNTAPDTKAMLDISSTSKGLLIPRMNTIQRTILATTEGLTVYDIDTHSYWFFKTPGGWTELASGGASPWAISGTDVFNTNTGNIGIGTSAPIRAGLIVNKKVGNSHAIFGDNTTGVSIESNFPGIHFNSYYNSGRKAIVTGYTSGAEMNPTTGAFSIYTSPSSTTIGNTAAVFERLNISKDGNVGIGIAIPTARLHIGGDVKIDQNNQLEFGAGIVGKEINAGKIGYGLFTPNTLDIVGGGTNSIPRKIRFWAEGGSKFEGPINVTNINTFTGTNTDNIYINANTTLAEFTKLGNEANTLAIKTQTYKTTLYQNSSPLQGSWSEAFITIPIPVSNIVSCDVLTFFTISNNGVNYLTARSINGGYFTKEGNGAFNLNANSNNTNFIMKYADCSLCGTDAYAVITVMYTNSAY